MSPWRWSSSTTVCRRWPTRWSSPTRAGRASPTRTRSRATPSGQRSSRTPLAAWGKAQLGISFPYHFLGFLVKNLSCWLFRILNVPSKIPCKGAVCGFILCLQFWKHLESRTAHAKSWSQEESLCSLKNLKNQHSLSTVGLILLFFWEKIVTLSLDSSALWWSQLVWIKLIKIWHDTFSCS